MRPAQIVIRVRRRKSVEMRPADRGKQQRIRLRGDDAVKAWVDGHGEGLRFFAGEAFLRARWLAT